MRFGLNTFLTSSGFSDEDLPLISEFKFFGADVIELAIVDTAEIVVSKLLDALQAANMEHLIVCGAMISGRDLRWTALEQRNGAHYISQLIELAETLGSRVVCGPLYTETVRANRHTPEEREAQLNLIAEHFKPLSVQAEAAGVIGN